MTVELKGIGKVTASKEVLNLLSIWATEASRVYEGRERHYMAKEAQEASSSIFEALEETGYYK